jgi:hypothetical protein
MATKEKKNVQDGKVNWEDIQLVRQNKSSCGSVRDLRFWAQVQKLIERCLELYMTQQEIVNALKMQANIEPGLTGLGAPPCPLTRLTTHGCDGTQNRAVWEKLQDQNPDFFRAYSTRLHVKEQIREFNTLVSQMNEQTSTFDGAK